ncbi:MAG: ADP-ribosylglycohydrolase family protein [Candidatus Bathyarchaeia archaeon]
MNLAEMEAVVKGEIAQRREEGRDVSSVEREFLESGLHSVEQLERLLKQLDALQPEASFPYDEPSTLDEIRARRPKGPRALSLSLSDEELLDRIRGGWLARCVGCILGKPVEGWTRAQIEKYLRLAEAYPLRDFFPLVSPLPEGFPPALVESRCLKGRVTQMVRDDDTDYTILGLHIAETYGRGFTTKNVGEEWLTHLPYGLVYTAERVAYRNLVNGLSPPETATYRNPYREWIGAQIRADIWGYICPGMPEAAAELAFRDAALSHVKNGIYGEMLIAAIIAASFATDDLEELVCIGLSEVPAQSRLAEAIQDTVAWGRGAQRWEDVWDKVMAKYGSYHPVHTINNAAMVVLALLMGQGDYERTVTTAVMCGLDTDCNGATAGSILGVILGAKSLPERWTSPLNDRITSYVTGFYDSQISELAKRTYKAAKTFRATAT